MSPANPEALWRQLVEEAREDAIDRAVAVSVAEAERELAAAGFDVRAERRRARARMASLEHPRRR